jgi:hypothetical protein
VNDEVNREGRRGLLNPTVGGAGSEYRGIAIFGVCVRARARCFAQDMVVRESEGEIRPSYPLI